MNDLLKSEVRVLKRRIKELESFLERWTDYYVDGMDPDDAQDFYIDTLAILEPEE